MDNAEAEKQKITKSVQQKRGPKIRKLILTGVLLAGLVSRD